MTDPIVQPVADPNLDPAAPITPEKSVSYETHRRLLDEKKKLQARADELEAKAKERELADITAKGDTQKLLDLARKEAAENKAALSALQEREVQAKKLSAIVRGMGASVDEKWYGVISQHIDDVVLNADTHEIEAMSVTSVVENLKKNWPEMLKKPVAGMPNGAPQGNGATTISYGEWKKLPLKEMKKWRQGQII